MKNIILISAAALSLSACGVNSVPTAEEEAKAAWANVENDYQRRADLVPNLVNTVKGFAAQEQEVLTEVTAARASATQTRIDADDLDDPAAMQRYSEAQDQLSGALSRLLVSVERYPDLRSQENFLMLQSQLEGLENRIAISRRDYNDAVRMYNTEIRTFPSLIAARFIYGAEPMQPYEATTEGAEEAPTVEF
ncbi:LemA family protein [Pacificimonas flava]|uniref:LemA n=1 Tax=Pacificimonas flava TaxID=1234595 RepID=M2U7Q4_9SPHN|nr:LemA family protein [Pacificimonas flava]EMD84028.1 LemA [Pacificimonas flava]MBB5281000.1 LemA protein [Pacificimonas flava]